MIAGLASARHERYLRRMNARPQEVRFEGVHGTLTVLRMAPAVVVLEFRGADIGEFGQGPFRELEASMAESERPIELFIDARHGKGVAVDVSGEWAQWLARNRGRLRHVSMLTSSRFIQLSAEFVRKFAGIEELMRIYADPAVWEGALAHSVANAGR